MKTAVIDLIPPATAITLDGLFEERVRRSQNETAYRHFNDDSGQWEELTWSEMLTSIKRWQTALLQENLQAGDRVAIMLKNCPSWVMFDQAALGLGLIVVPIYLGDRADNIAHVLADSGSKLLLTGTALQWKAIQAACASAPQLTRVITLFETGASSSNTLVRDAAQWLPQAGAEFHHCVSDPHALATIIYTSGTTGKSKGVMLSHHNLLSNAWASLQPFDVGRGDLLLSFMPLSHALERMAGYYLPVMAGATVAHVRSIQHLQEDLASIRPSILIAVPRIFERIQAGIQNQLDKRPAGARRLYSLAVGIGYSRFEHAQRRAAWRPSHLLWPLLDRLIARKIRGRLGGRLRLILCGGAALSPDISRTFIGLGLNLLQGYGLTETSPVISVNHVNNNLPSSVGLPLQDIEVRLGAQDVLQVRGPNVMLGYWNNEAATRAICSTDGWLDTGDVARIDAAGHITITGRIKEIIVLSNGEKVPPSDMESAITRDPLFEQVMIVGEGKAYLSLLAVVNRERWEQAAAEYNLPEGWPAGLQQARARTYALTRVTHQVREFPGYARIRRITLLDDAWSVENGLLTPTLKVRRSRVLEYYRAAFEEMYAGYHTE